MRIFYLSNGLAVSFNPSFSEREALMPLFNRRYAVLLLIAASACGGYTTPPGPTLLRHARLEAGETVLT